MRFVPYWAGMAYITLTAGLIVVNPVLGGTWAVVSGILIYWVILTDGGNNRR